MKENLNKNIVTVLILEILALVISVIFHFIIESPFIIFWGIFTLITNTLAIFLLFKHKPKFHILTSAIALSIVLIPFLFIYYILSKMQC